MAKVASGEVSDFSIRIQNASFWIHEKSVNPFKNDIIDIPFIGPGKPWPGKTHVNHVTSI